MALEIATYISDLVVTNPTATDPKSQGDDHLRLVKQVLKATFPNVAGAVAATHAELSLLAGATGAITFPAGTRMPFAQAAAPTGWTQDVTDNANNRMLRVVPSGGGAIGGSSSPILNNVVPAHTHGFTTGNVSADHQHFDSGHSHNIGISNAGVYGSGPGSDVTVLRNGPTNTSTSSAVIGGASGNHTHAGGTDNGSSQTNWTPRYIDMIICSKN